MTDFGMISYTLIWGSVFAYSIAMIAFAIDLARLQDKVGGRPRGKAVGIGMSTAFLGMLLHLGGVIARGLATGSAPWIDLYEFIITGTLTAVVLFFILQLWRDFRWLGSFITAGVALALVPALRGFYSEPGDLPAILDSYWLVVHVGVAVFATGVFLVAGGITIFQLLQHRREDKLATGVDAGSAGPGFLSHLPTASNLESLSFRVHAIGFVLWTFTLIGGAIWAEDAWGRYWGWDAKEVGTLIVWILYAIYLHARNTRGWSGKRAAGLALFGLFAVVMNMTVVNWFLTEKHGYALVQSFGLM